MSELIERLKAVNEAITNLRIASINKTITEAHLYGIEMMICNVMDDFDKPKVVTSNQVSIQQRTETK